MIRRLRNLLWAWRMRCKPIPFDYLHAMVRETGWLPCKVCGSLVCRWATPARKQKMEK